MLAVIKAWYTIRIGSIEKITQWIGIKVIFTVGVGNIPEEDWRMILRESQNIFVEVTQVIRPCPTRCGYDVEIRRIVLFHGFQKRQRSPSALRITHEKTITGNGNVLCDILIKLAETEHTVRSSEDAEEISIPKRVILSDSEVTEVGDSGTLVVSERFAKKRGWV